LLTDGLIPEANRRVTCAFLLAQGTFGVGTYPTIIVSCT